MCRHPSDYSDLTHHLIYIHITYAPCTTDIGIFTDDWPNKWNNYIISYLAIDFTNQHNRKTSKIKPPNIDMWLDINPIPVNSKVMKINFFLSF